MLFKNKMTPIAAIQAAAMPELYSSVSSSPKIHVLYLAPGQEIISPEQLMASNPEIFASGGGSQMAKLSPSILVKYGTHTSLIEAKNMLYVAERTSVPVPRLFAAYAYGPLDRDVDDFGSVYDTYIFMELIEGEDLGKTWGKCTSAEKQKISTDVKTYMTELRSLPAAGYIGSVHNGPVTDVMLEWSTTSKGPFKSEQDFNATVADTFVAKSKTQVGPYIRGMLDAHKHEIVFTHGDLRPNNIIVKNGHVTAIVDWEMAGWYPDYWEFVKAFHQEMFTSDWASHLLGVLTPYYCEQLMHEKLMMVLW
ncbi:phosphotransferase enzyme family protein [Tothia fuscella]|uniref:Phosphotransferase enzyme family protein n=1 Tax=Tothia fuscella TaxID=1048955 RepID=A0A9P4U2G9_9PEZI|nr:phosphotransferase enzyme family protein [Tothia fuscella]